MRFPGKTHALQRKKGSMPATNHVTKVFYAYLIWGKQKGGENVTDFEKLFTDNQRFIFKYLIKLCRDVSLAEELTQETFFRAYVNIKQLADESKAPSWLCRIAKNTYFAWYNKNKRLKRGDTGRYRAYRGANPGKRALIRCTELP